MLQLARTRMASLLALSLLVLLLGVASSATRISESRNADADAPPAADAITDPLHLKLEKLAAASRTRVLQLSSDEFEEYASHKGRAYHLAVFLSAQHLLDSPQVSLFVFCLVCLLVG